MPDPRDHPRDHPRDGPRPRPGDILAALSLLTRLPLPAGGGPGRGAPAAWAWPLAGAICGGLAGIAGSVAMALGLGPGIAAGLAVGVSVAVTGALHEDGLADTADGFWGGWDRQRRLEIMKDSRIGTYGVLALILSIGLRWTALAALFASGHILSVLIAIGALSRLPMVGLSWAMDPARAAGLSARVGRPSIETTALATLMAVLVVIPSLGLPALAALIATGAAALTAGAIARAKIGGQTGDVLGAAQQIAEIFALLTLLALLPT